MVAFRLLLFTLSVAVAAACGLLVWLGVQRHWSQLKSIKEIKPDGNQLRMTFANGASRQLVLTLRAQAGHSFRTVEVSDRDSRVSAGDGLFGLDSSFTFEKSHL